MSDDFLEEFPDDDGTVEHRPMAYFPAGFVSEIPKHGGKSVWIKARRVAVFKVGSEIVAFKDRCPHMGAYLSDGRVAGNTVVCSWHGWTFELGEGRCLTKDWARLETYRVRVTGDRIEIEVPVD